MSIFNFYYHSQSNSLDFEAMDISDSSDTDNDNTQDEKQLSLLDIFETRLRMVYSFANTQNRNNSNINTNDSTSNNDNQTISSSIPQTKSYKSAAHWRLHLLQSMHNTLENNSSSVDYILKQLQQHMIYERYGFNNDIALTLCKYNADINAIITFRAIKCTLLHAIIQCYAFHSSSTASMLDFHHMLIKHNVLLDIKDEYGRTPLTIAMWQLSVNNPDLRDVNIIRALIKYGFSPFMKYRGMTIVEKLEKTCHFIRKVQIKNEVQRRRLHPRGTIRNSKLEYDRSSNNSKAIQKLLQTLRQIWYFQQRIEAIEYGLQRLIQRDIIGLDVAGVIRDCIGITHHSQILNNNKTKMKQAKVQQIYRNIDGNGNEDEKQYKIMRRERILNRLRNGQ